MLRRCAVSSASASRVLVARAVRPAAVSAASFSTNTSAGAASPSATPASSASAASARLPSMKDSVSESAQRAFALRLYKALLRAHRAVLPAAMRSLGDTYVREEFKLHKSAKPQHLHGFFTGWIEYLDTMRTQAPGQWGLEMTEEQRAALNDEQKAQLTMLQKSTANLNEQWTAVQETTQFER